MEEAPLAQDGSPPPDCCLVGRGIRGIPQPFSVRHSCAGRRREQWTPVDSGGLGVVLPVSRPV